MALKCITNPNLKNILYTVNPGSATPPASQVHIITGAITFTLARQKLNWLFTHQVFHSICKL